MNNDNQNNDNNEMKSSDIQNAQTQHNIEANANAVKTGTKGLATAAGAYLGGEAGAKVGAKIGDAVTNSKLGNAVANTAGKAINDVNKISPFGKMNQKAINAAHDSGAIDATNKGIDMATNGSGLAKNNSMNNKPSVNNGKQINRKNGLNGQSKQQKNNNFPFKKPNMPKMPKFGSSNNIDEEEGEESTNNPLDDVKDALVEKAKQKALAVVIKATITFFTAVVVPLLPTLLIIIMSIVLVTSMFNFSYSWGKDSSTGEATVNASFCNTVEITDENNEKNTYDIKSYLYGTVYYYYSDYKNVEAYKAATVGIYTDLLHYSKIKKKVCSIDSTFPYYKVENLNDDDTKVTDEEKNNYEDIKISVNGVFGYVITDYHVLTKTRFTEEALINITKDENYKTILGNYYHTSTTDDDHGYLVKVNDVDKKTANGGTTCNSAIKLCSNVYITSGNNAGNTYSLDDFVAGVVAHEIGSFKNLEVFKAQAIAARSYLMNHATINGDICEVANDGSLGFKETNDTTVKQAATDTSGVVLIKNESILTTEWDSFCYSSKDANNYYLAQKNQKIPVEWATNKVNSMGIGTSLVNTCGTEGDGGHGRGMSQFGALYLAESGNNYEQILKYYYGDDVSIASSNCSASCQSYGDWENWKQFKGDWSTVKLLPGTDTLKESGCLITSYAILLARSAVALSISEFNPGTFASWLGSNGYIGSSSLFNNQNGALSKLNSNFSVASYNSSSINEVINYLKNGDLVIVGVNCRKGTPGHYIAIDDIRSKETNYSTLYIWDPGSSNRSTIDDYNGEICTIKTIKNSDVNYYENSGYTCSS